MLTVKELTVFLNHKKEHYPVSDEFIKEHQQKSGGYIDFAGETGHLIDAAVAEPNQKWHFLESWILRSLEDGTMSWEDDAYDKIYNNRLKCPELWLWFLEALGLEPSLIDQVRRLAVTGKHSGEHVFTTAKKIREIVPWDMIEHAVKANNENHL